MSVLQFVTVFGKKYQGRCTRKRIISEFSFRRKDDDAVETPRDFPADGNRFDIAADPCACFRCINGGSGIGKADPGYISAGSALVLPVVLQRLLRLSGQLADLSAGDRYHKVWLRRQG